MEKNYEEQYLQIVHGEFPVTYNGPEQQGNSIQKCSILKPIGEIEYSSYSKNIREQIQNL